MHNIWEWIKSHPVLIALIVGAVVLVLFVSGSGSSGGTAVAGSSGPSDAEVNASAAIQIANAQGQAQSAQLSAQLAAQQSNNATSVTIAGLQSNSADLQTTKAADIQLAGIQAQQAVQSAGITSNQVISLASDALQASIASTQAQTDQARIQAVVDITNAPTNLAIAQIQGLGPGGLGKVIHDAEGTKNSYVNIGGITAGRNTPQSNTGSAIASGLGSLGAALAAFI